MSSDFQQVVHLNLAEDCMNKFKMNIEKLCKTEQVCTGPETRIASRPQSDCKLACKAFAQYRGWAPQNHGLLEGTHLGSV